MTEKLNNPDMTDAEYALLVSFPDQSASYVNGFEAGMLWESMQRGDAAEIEYTIHEENRLTVQRMAIAGGWDAEFGRYDDTWTTVKLSKTSTAPAIPNPHGLRVVT